MKQAKKRTRVIPIRVTEEMYAQLQDISVGYDIPVALYCYLSVLKSLSFHHDVMHVESEAVQNLIP